MQKTIFYEDELNDEFSTAVIHAKKIDEHYKYGTLNFNWRLSHFIIYRIIATPIAYLFLKLKYHHKIINKEVMKNYLNDSFFLYANHTNATADALIPSFVSFPNHAYVIVHPNNVSMPVLGKITPSLGALPLPDDLKASRNFMDAIKNRIEHKRCIVIYPEAHIWPFYTKIRPFNDTSFRYPIQYKTPIFSFTNTYQKRKFSKTPQIVTYIDGPFFSDESLSLKEKRADLRDKVFAAMNKRSINNNVEMIKYIKKGSTND
jgi:1-acyl-sn-glycerol-3-phosphate acyltransferase